MLFWVSPTVSAFFIWQAVVSAAETLLFAVMAWRATRRTTQERAQYDSQLMRSMWRIAAQLSVVSIFAVVLKQVDRVLLVAPPAPDHADEPLIREFLHPALSPEAPRRAAASTRLVVGEGDSYCSVAQAKELAEALRVEVDVIVDGGHLNVDAGYGPWGAVLKWVRSARVPLTPR